MTGYFTVDRASLLLTPQIWIFSLLKYLSGLIRLLLDDRALRVTRSGVRMAQSGPSSLPSSSVFRSLMDDEHQDQFRAWNCNWQWGINIQIGEQELGITQNMVVWHQTIIWNRDEKERECNPDLLSHLSLREAKPINSKKFVLQASYQARAKPCLCLTILERDSETDIMVMRRPSSIVNKTSSKAFLSIAYCENIIKFTFFSWKCAGHDNILQK